MDDLSYRREIVVSSTPSTAYQALTADIKKWWTDDCDHISKTGDTTTFRFGPTYWVMRAVSAVPDERVSLKCIDAHHVHEGLPSSILDEWRGTTLTWQIYRQGAKTRIVFEHEGLDPSLNCYEVCEQGWDYYFLKSLKHYLDTGVGSPYQN